jgi:hypothetical protein
MTNLNPDSTNRDDHGLGWVTLAEGVDMSRAWLSAHTPQLFTAWQQAQNAQRRLQLAQQIQQVAAATESDRGQDPGENPDDPRNEYVNIRIQWAETTRYEADFYVSPYSTDEQLWTEIGMVPDALRRTLDVTDADNSIVSIVDLDGDGIASVLERAVSAGNTVSTPDDWADLAVSIDERLAEGPDWPALAAALDRAAAAGYDVAADLPRLAYQDALPERHPARELQYRLMADCDAALVSAGDASAASSDSGPGQGTRPPDVTPPSAAPGDAPAR